MTVSSRTQFHRFARKGLALLPVSMIVTGGAVAAQQAPASASPNCGNVSFTGNGQPLLSNEVSVRLTSTWYPVYHLKFNGSACTDGTYLTGYQINTSDIEFVQDNNGWFWPSSGYLSTTEVQWNETKAYKNGPTTQLHARVAFNVVWGSHVTSGDYDVIINGDGSIQYQHFWAGNDGPY